MDNIFNRFNGYIFSTNVEFPIESDSDLDHRYFDKGYAPDDDLDAPNNFVQERSTTDETIETLIDDFENVDLVNVLFSEEQVSGSIVFNNNFFLVFILDYHKLSFMFA